jgi:E3 ubiquitin-protein ligase MYCBP2
LHPDCVSENPDITLGEDDGSFCSICYVSGIGDQPSIQLGCKHIFHVDCIREKVRQKWSGPRITFLFKTCPSCKAEIEAPHHPEISMLLEEAQELEEDIRKKALERAKHENLHKEKRLQDPNDEYYNNLEKYAMARLSYYT